MLFGEVCEVIFDVLFRSNLANDSLIFPFAICDYFPVAIAKKIDIASFIHPGYASGWMLKG
jgi:hypothetical protein